MEGLRETFDSQYPNQYFRNVNIELDYPVVNQAYPAIFVKYDDTVPLRRAGISMVEMADVNTGALVAPFARWRFQGMITLTVVSLVTALERDNLYDEVVRVVAFGREDPTLVGRFHSYIDDNDLIASNLQTDVIHPQGADANPGTPWGTNEIMFERSLGLEIVGEFTPDPAANTLLSLSKIIITPIEDDGTGTLYPQSPISI